MSFICQNCGKGKVVGTQRRHKRGVAGKRWRRRAQPTTKIFKPNIQVTTVNDALKGEVKMKLCAKCIKKFKKEGKIKDFRKKKN